MASRLKEEEKLEKIIRGLTKLNDNRRCINCNSLGPQYICTTFSTFVCISCSGIHREFTHRVKSISMAKFTAAEVAALQTGGNKQAREIYFKDWDLSKQSLPDSSNPEKLRDFIKSVYVQRRYTGENKGRMSDYDDSYDTRRPDSRSKYNPSQSPSYEDNYDDRRRTSVSRPDAGRHEDRGYDDRTDFKKSPGRFEYNTERRSDYNTDRFGARGDDRDRRFDDRDHRYEDRDRRFDDWDRRPDGRDRRSDDRDRRPDDRDRRPDERDRRFEDRDRRVDDKGRRPDEREWRSQTRQYDDSDRRSNRRTEASSPPIRSVRDILGDDVPKLRVIDGKHTNGRHEDGGSPRSTSSQGDSFKEPQTLPPAPSANGNAVAGAAAIHQRGNSGSLIDFSAESEEPAAITTQFDPFSTSNQTAAGASAASAQLDFFASSNNSTVAMATPFDPFSTPNQAAATAATTGWASFDSSPAKEHPLGPTQIPLGYPSAPVGAQSDFSSLSYVPPAPQASVGFAAFMAPNSMDQWNDTLAADSKRVADNNFAALGVQQPNQQTAADKWNIPSHQQWNPPSIPQTQTLQPTLPEQKSIPTSIPDGSRKELPEDLFVIPPQSFGYMAVAPPNYGISYVIPQQPTMPTMVMNPPYNQASKSRNPFDLPGDSNPTQGFDFPNMASLQSNLPNAPYGPVSVPKMGPVMSSQWMQSAAPPASFPPATMQGGTRAFVHPPAPTSMQGYPPVSGMGQDSMGNFSNGQAFSTNSGFSAHPGLGNSGFGGSFSSESSAYSSAGNPFG